MDPIDRKKNRKIDKVSKGTNVSVNGMESIPRALSGCSKDEDDGTNDQDSRRLPSIVNSKSSSARQEGSKRRKLNSASRRHHVIEPLGSSIECAFCHSSRTTEGSGPMVHYWNGKPITVDEKNPANVIQAHRKDEKNQANVIHAHRKCINWCPKVYFDGETAINLEKELYRASRLKCSKCGLKGAALGCFYKHCRKTFHVPCAYTTSGCRWDCVDLHVLCPSHASEELPCDKSESGKKIEINDFMSQLYHSIPQLLINTLFNITYSDVLFYFYFDFANLVSPFRVRDRSDALRSELRCNQSSAGAPHAASGWILCGSDLSENENELLVKFAMLTGASLAEQWEQNVTHVIASIDEFGACSRTFKVLMATLKGIWVLKIDWVKDYLEAKEPVAEEPYEVSLDIHGFADGPKKGRLRAMNKASNLFSGLKFYLIGLFPDLLKDLIEELVFAAGGTILNRDDFLNQRDSNTCYVVYNGDPLGECIPVDIVDLLKRRFERAKDFAAKTGAWVICHKWLWDAIATSSLEVS